MKILLYALAGVALGGVLVLMLRRGSRRLDDSIDLEIERMEGEGGVLH